MVSFGSMPPPTEPAERNVYTVSRLNREVRILIERGLGVVWVEGELSNLSVPSSGHWYFSMKDRDAQLRCAMFRQKNMSVGFTPKSGQQILARGRVSLYEPRGDYQFIVEHLEEAGVGALKREFERLKAKLAAEGLFALERKRSLPRFPRRIGVVTSPTGAALRDILHILGRRFPPAAVLIYPTPVQGDASIPLIVEAIQTASARAECDVLIVARGGGSIEDLWAFNDERVARAIHASAIPVVSGIGHEIDFTIADFVADLRAPTPSAAAELIAPDKADLLRRFRAYGITISRNASEAVARQKSRLEIAARGALFREPANLIATAWQSVDLAERVLHFSARDRMGECRKSIEGYFARLREHRPDQFLQIKRHFLEATAARMRQRVSSVMQSARHSLERADGLIRILAPKATLKRGFSITTDEAGVIVRSSKAVKKGRKIVTRLADGTLKSVVE
jgi:exodeoxyribonuclease VII large subunit